MLDKPRERRAMMQENKFKEATGFYEPIVKKNFDSILNVSAIVLANLCVSYIMTSQNEEAEELMRKIEKEEEQFAYEDPDKKVQCVQFGRLMGGRGGETLIRVAGVRLLGIMAQRVYIS